MPYLIASEGPVFLAVVPYTAATSGRSVHIMLCYSCRYNSPIKIQPYAFPEKPIYRQICLVAPDWQEP